MDEINEILKRALAVVQTKPAIALKLLEAGLKRARDKADRRGVSVLARHAAVVSTESNDLVSAVKYYDEALGASPKDAYLHFAKGHLHSKLGQEDQARLAMAQSLVLAAEQRDDDMIEMAREASARFDDEADCR